MQISSKAPSCNIINHETRSPLECEFPRLSRYDETFQLLKLLKKNFLEDKVYSYLLGLLHSVSKNTTSTAVRWSSLASYRVAKLLINLLIKQLNTVVAFLRRYRTGHSLREHIPLPSFSFSIHFQPLDLVFLPEKSIHALLNYWT
jgi:hypothetical protein